MAPLVVYALATVALTWPLARGGARSFFTFDGLPRADVLLVTWILAWDLHALTTDPTTLFDGNIFHPVPQILAASEHHLGNLPLFAPVWALTGNPILALNCVPLAAYLLGGLCMHVLVRRWTGSRAAAYVAGLAFLAAPWRVPTMTADPYLVSVQYFPLILVFLDQAAAGRRWSALWAAAALTIQSLCSYYLAYMAFVLAGAYAVADVAVRGVRGRGRAAAAMAIALVAPLVVLLPLSLPYVGAKAGGRLAFEAAPAFTEFFRLAGAPANIVRHYVGWGPLALAVLGAAPLAWRRGERDAAVRGLALVLIAVAGFLLARGPADGPLLSPWEWLRAVVPGFGNFRAPSRFGCVVSFATAALAGLAVAEGERRLRGRGAPPLVALAAVAGIVVLAPAWSRPPLRPWTVPFGSAVPGSYRWLAEHGAGGPLLELPTHAGAEETILGARAAYFSIYHWLPLLNGHTGYYPAASRFLLQHAEQLPSAPALDRLVRCSGLRWILVHDAPGVRRRAWDELRSVRLAGEFAGDGAGTDRLYEVIAPAGDGCRLFTPGVTADGAAVVPLADVRGTLAVTGVPERVAAGGETQATIRLDNESDGTWPCTSIDPAGRFELGARWELDGRALAAETFLAPADVPPGARLEMPVWLGHPARPGRYLLRVTAGQRAARDDSPPSALEWSREVIVAP